MSTVVQGASVQPWRIAADVCRASATGTATHFEDTVTTRQASATALTTLRGRTVSPVCLDTTVTQGKKIVMGIVLKYFASAHPFYITCVF